MRRRVIIILLVFLLGGVFSGTTCIRDMDIKSRYAELELKLNPLYGSTQDEVAVEFGPPDFVKTVKKYEVWYYYKSYGKRKSRGTLSGVDEGVWEAYDRVYIYFKNKKMVKWDAHVQR